MLCQAGAAVYGFGVARRECARGEQAASLAARHLAESPVWGLGFGILLLGACRDPYGMGVSEVLCAEQNQGSLRGQEELGYQHELYLHSL